MVLFYIAFCWYCVKVLNVRILFKGTGAATIASVIRHVLSGSRVQSHGEGKRRVETVKLEGFVRSERGLGAFSPSGSPSDQ